MCESSAKSTEGRSDFVSSVLAVSASTKTNHPRRLAVDGECSSGGAWVPARAPPTHRKEPIVAFLFYLFSGMLGGVLAGLVVWLLARFDVTVVAWTGYATALIVSAVAFEQCTHGMLTRCLG